MLYERSYSIEKRLQNVLELVRLGKFSTPEIAERVGVSVPTISRDVTALRERGYAIHAERKGSTWCYSLAERNAADGRQNRSREAVPA